MQWWPQDPKQRRRAWVRVAVLASVVAFGGYEMKQRFGWGGGDLTPQLRAEAPADTPLPAAGELPPAPPVRSEWKAIAVKDDRAARQALWLTPDGLAAGKQPLVIALHGDGGSARSFHEQWTYEEASGAWATVVYGEGIGSSWDTESQEGNRDVLFLDALIDEAVSQRNVDPARVFLTGYSSGGFLAQLYACQRSARVRGIATHEAGAPYNQREHWPNGSPKCPGQTSVATLVTHGADDFTVTLSSGVYSAFYWASVNGCDVRHAQKTGYSQCYAYEGCSAGKPAAFCEISGLGHWVWSEAAPASVRFFQQLGG